MWSNTFEWDCLAIRRCCRHQACATLLEGRREVDMAVVRRFLNLLVVASLIVASGLLVASQRTADASMNAPVAPLMMASVPGSRTVYVVSTSNIFESNHPSACGFGCYLLERTTDGGVHFTVRTLPRTRYIDDSLTGTLDQLSFANSSDGYALMGSGQPRSLFATDNGGGSWRREVIATGTVILRFATTRTHVIAVIARCKGTSTCSRLRLATSTLGADHWTITPLANWPAGRGVGLGAFNSTVWLTQQAIPTVRLMTSHNLGVTFSRRVAPDLGSVYACSMTATSNVTLWAECPTGMASSFHYSGDGGRTWNVIPVKQFTNTGGGYFDPLSNSLAYLAVGLDDSGGGRNFYRIAAQGRTLTAVGKLPCSEIDGLVFIDASHGFAACDKHSGFASTVLLQTSNGGTTWSLATDFYRAV
jgi:photosystem II stability/assembly factor-like uncharacterized protein